MSYRTFTVVVRMPDDPRFDIDLVDDPTPLFQGTGGAELVFWTSENGVTELAKDLGADPESWSDSDA